MSVIFERKVWCRYVCALGNMCGVYSMASILEVRANADVCVNQCTTHQCFKGGKSVQLAGKAEGSIAVFASFNIIWPFQLLLVIGGVLWSLFVVYKNFRRDGEEGSSQDRRLVFFMLTLISLYGVAIGSVFVALGRII